MSQTAAPPSPSQAKEMTVMTVWPSISSTAAGRWLGRRYKSDFGFHPFGIPVTLGSLWAILSIPVAIAFYFNKIVPRIPFVFWGLPNPFCRRYRLTNRRVVVDHPFTEVEEKSISLDRFDSIDVVELPGHQWYHAGDLVFKNGQVETFRLEAVPRPETFRQTCLKSRMSYVGVQKARQAGTAV